MQSGPQADDGRYFELRDFWRGVFVLFCSLAIAFGSTFWSKSKLHQRTLSRSGEGATMSSLRGVIGWPGQIDAVASLSGARKMSHVRELRSLTIEGVGSDGTVDVTDQDHWVRYVFQSDPRRNIHAEGKTPHGRGPALVCPRQSIKILRDGLLAEPENDLAQCPRDQGPELPLPRCGPKDVWARAVAKGIPKELRGRLDYNSGRLGPVWKLSVPAKRFTLVLSSDCRHEFSREELAGKPAQKNSSAASSAPKL